MDEGPCRGEIERYFYNTITQKCETFYYGGCQGNENNFKSFQECQKKCFRIPSRFGVFAKSPSASLEVKCILALMCRRASSDVEVLTKLLLYSFPPNFDNRSLYFSCFLRIQKRQILRFKLFSIFLLSLLLYD